MTAPSAPLDTAPLDTAPLDTASLDTASPDPGAPGARLDSTLVDLDRDVDQAEDEFARLELLLTEYAGLDDGPRRSALRERLVTGYLPLAQRLAWKYRDRGVQVEDLFQVASIGLLNAVDRFDPTQGSAFLSFALPTIQGEIRRYFRDRAWSMRVPRGLKDRHLAIAKATSELSADLNRAPRPSEIAAHLELSVEEVLEGLQAGEAYSSASLDEKLSAAGNGGYSLADVLGEADARLEMVEYRDTLRPLLEALPERERAIVMLRFFGEMTQSQIATEIGVSQMHVSRLLGQILSRFRQQLEQD
ncbi:MAG TPA: SigB/SigF/SigG family RNA polymerase sigma factor [Pseudonocardia sp.]